MGVENKDKTSSTRGLGIETNNFESKVTKTSRKNDINSRVRNKVKQLRGLENIINSRVGKHHRLIHWKTPSTQGLENTINSGVGETPSTNGLENTINLGVGKHNQLRGLKTPSTQGLEKNLNSGVGEHHQLRGCKTK